MSANKIIPVVLSGGVGTRLWPISRVDAPKQFCRLTEEESLFQITLKRVSNRKVFESPILVTGTRYRTMAEIQAAEAGIAIDRFICEPEGRNTGPAVALAAALDDRGNQDDILLVLPSDHRIADNHAFQKAIRSAQKVCIETDDIVTLGVPPIGPETGYGYIKAEAKDPSNGCKVSRFVEKPTVDAAKAMLAEGSHFWNAGIFMARRGRFIEEFQSCAPLLWETVVRSVRTGTKDTNSFSPHTQTYSKTPEISFDHSVMEYTDRVSVVTAETNWNDLGSFDALHDIAEADWNGNVLDGDVVVNNSTGCLAVSTDRLVALSDVQDIVVVATKDAVLVTPRNKTQSVKALVTQLESRERKELVSHLGEDRPWGRFDSLDRGDSHQVKRITVKPSGQLSLQYHFHRSEHWIVVSGTATVTVGKTVQDLGPGQNVFIPQGEVHRLENFTDKPVELIEVQLGDYFGEDDIVRLDDVYGREPQPELSEVA
ncbi:MAG: mannose-1-phosphate guanylyltransferase/mannose-6-phosphate isomerase [Hyphomicrobiales bacterium]